ncbi:RNA-directed DNA polymerase, eukaryota, reverse transcriptase zinc-binding domain protein [Tanacetum coccineum]
MGISVEKNRVDLAACKIGCLTLESPFSYLGSKVGALMSRIHSWNEVVDRVIARLLKWKMKTLSIGGRLTLLKSVLGSMPIYHMSIFKVPMKKKVLASKDKGGLGVSSLYELNRALLFKWVWRFFTQSSSLWTRVIKAIHGNDGKIGKKTKSAHPSIWLDIVHEMDLLEKQGLASGIKKKLGNGENTCFWEDVWCGDSAFNQMYPRIYALETCKHVNVASKLQQTSLDFSFCRGSRGGVEQEQFADLVAKVEGISLVNMRDRLDCLPTRLNISRRGLDIESILCPMCNIAVESTRHIFFMCDIAKEIFRKISCWWDVSYTDLSSYEEWLDWIVNLSIPMKHKRLLEGVCYVMWWYLWIYRNKTFFGVKNPSKALIFDDVVSRTFY